MIHSASGAIGSSVPHGAHEVADRLESMRRAFMPVVIGAPLIAIAYAIPGRAVDWILPAALGALCAVGTWRLVRITPAFLTGMPWFLLTFGFYYGFGAVMYSFAPIEVRDYVDVMFPVDAAWLRTTNVLNAVGFAVVSLAFFGGMSLPARPRPVTLDSEYEIAVAQRTMWVCLVIGYLARLAIRGQDPTGASGGGMIKSLENLILVALALLCFLVARGRRRYLWLLVPLAGVELYLTFVMLMKSDVMTVGLFMFLGLFWAKPSRKLLVGGAAAGIATYLLLAPIIQLGRAIRWDLGGDISSKELLANAVSSTDAFESVASRPASYPWTRVMSANAEAFAMSQYDAGLPGKSYEMAGYMFIPRALWPDKPIITPGVVFNEAALGSSTSASAPGVLGEAYWNGGWAYVVMSAIYVGFFLAIFTRIVTSCLVGGDSRILPAATLVVVIACRPDAWFAASFIGTVPILIVFIVGLRLAVRLPDGQPGDGYMVAGPAAAAR